VQRLGHKYKHTRIGRQDEGKRVIRWRPVRQWGQRLLLWAVGGRCPGPRPSVAVRQRGAVEKEALASQEVRRRSRAFLTAVYSWFWPPHFPVEPLVLRGIVTGTGKKRARSGHFLFVLFLG
jgi:hypothetical protein